MKGKNREPLDILKIGMVSSVFVSAAFITFGVLPSYLLSVVLVMVLFYLMVTVQSINMMPVMTIFTQPWKEDSGLASGLLQFSCSVVSSCLAMGSSTITERYSVSGLLFFIGVVYTIPFSVFALSMQMGWLSRSGAAENEQHDDQGDGEDAEVGHRSHDRNGLLVK